MTGIYRINYYCQKIYKDIPEIKESVFLRLI